MSLRLLILGLLATTGCTFGDGGDETDTDDPPIPDGSSADCGDTPPVIEEVWVEDGGMTTYEGDEYPSIVVRARVTDEDADLHYYEMAVWYDTGVDGRVLTEGTQFQTFATLSDQECEVPEATVGMIIMLAGSPPFSTEVEFGVIVSDDEGHDSGDGDTAVAVFTTPDESGSYDR